MPYKIQVRDKDRLVLSRIWGTLDNETFSNYIFATEALKQIPEDYRLLVILDPETELEMDTQFIRSLAQRPPVFGAGSNRVIVATENVAFGLSRIYTMESRTMGDQYTIVRTVEEAVKILKLDLACITAAVPNAASEFNGK